MTLKAACTWGEGPDVLMVLEEGEGDMFMAYEAPYHTKPPQVDSIHGYIRSGSICLTADEAEVLGLQLIEAAKQARALDVEFAKHLNHGRGD